MGNSTIFTGNLINRHPLFLEVLEKVCPLVEERLGSSFQVSEFKLVTGVKAKISECGGTEIFLMMTILMNASISKFHWQL